MKGTSTVDYQELLEKELEIINLKKSVKSNDDALSDVLAALITYSDPSWVNSDQFKEHLHKAMTNADIQIKIISLAHTKILGAGKRIIELKTK